MPGLEGRVALVTGASQGIGRACAVVLAEAGAKVALCARSQEKLEQLAQEIAGKGGEAAAFKMDVASEDEIKAGREGSDRAASARSTSWSTTPASPATSW